MTAPVVQLPRPSVTLPAPSKCAGWGGPGIPPNPCLKPGGMPRCQLCPASPSYWRREERAAVES